MYKLITNIKFTEAYRKYLLDKAFQHNISRTANCISVFTKYDDATKSFHFLTRDLNGSKKLHKSTVQIKGEPETKKEALKIVYNGDVAVNCDCEDFKYRRAYKATFLRYNALPLNERRPSQKTNPEKLGTVCKHLYHILKNFRTLVSFATIKELP